MLHLHCSSDKLLRKYKKKKKPNIQWDLNLQPFNRMACALPPCIERTYNFSKRRGPKPIKEWLNRLPGAQDGDQGTVHKADDQPQVARVPPHRLNQTSSARYKIFKPIRSIIRLQGIKQIRNPIQEAPIKNT